MLSKSIFHTMTVLSFFASLLFSQEVAPTLAGDPLYGRALKANAAFKYRPDRFYGFLNASSNIPEASFYLGTWYVDHTPFMDLKLPAGQYNYAMTIKKSNPVKGTFFIKPNEKTDVTSTLVRRKGVVSILTHPPEFSVSIGDKNYGTTQDTGLKLTDLDVGSYIVKLEKQGWITLERTVRVIDGERTGLNNYMTEQYGTLIVDSDQPQSFVYVNNIYWGKSPITIGGLRTGKTVVKVEQEKYGPWVKTVLIRPGDIQKISATLQKNSANRHVSPYGELKGAWGDKDGDGIPNEMDKCPEDPEDIDGYQEQDGCPDPDNDNDGIADITDKCPLQTEDFDAFEDQDGCPDLDNDKDNIADSVDLCISNTEDRDDFEDLDGCPDPDNDIDGISDSVDVAPNDPEDADNFQDKDGIPDLDNDNDGVKDYLDACPNEAEVFNNFQDDDGCPDELVPEPRPGYTKHIPIVLDNPLPESIFPQIDSIYNAMLVFPSMVVEITVNCDGKGRLPRKLKVTEDKAMEIEKYLGYRNQVEKNRYTVKGVGAADPIASNVSDEGRVKNNRITIKRVR